MSTPSRPCDRSALVEAMFDGRLGSVEEASTTRHLKTCADCRVTLEELRSLQQRLRESTGEVSPLAHQRARLALLRTAATPPAQPSAKTRRSVMLLAAAAITLPLAAWAATATFPSSATVPTPLVSTSPAIASATPNAAPTRTPLGTGGAPPAGEASARANLAVGEEVPAAPSTAGSSRPEPASRDLSAVKTPPREHVESAFAAHPKTTSTLPTAAHPTSREAPGAATRASVAPAAPIASSPVAGEASREFAEALGALSEGDFSSSAGKLERFAKAHPSDVRVEEAAYLEAIALERSGRSADAKAAARRYLAAYPSGAHRVQARRLAGD